MSDYTHGEYVVSAGQGRYYTPTTEEVRRRYMFGCWQEYQDTSGDYKAEIDRWLAEVKAQVWEEAYMTGVSDVIADKGATMNPYRQGETE